MKTVEEIVASKKVIMARRSNDGFNGYDYRTFDLPETEREYLYKAVIAEADKRIAELNKEFESL